MKKSIATRIIISYIVLIATSLLFVGMLFSFAARAYMERLAVSSLQNDIDVISQAIKKGVNNREDVKDIKARLLLKERLKVLAAAESDWVIVDRNIEVLFPSKNSETVTTFQSQIAPGLDGRMQPGKKRQEFIRIRSADKEYILVYRTLGFKVLGESGPVLILYASVHARELIRNLSGVLILSMFIIGLIAVFFGILLARSIASPVIKLKKRAEVLSKRDFDTRVDINTGDELEELANAFDKMAGELKEYDIAQKRFVQNASHELKTPLMSIQGYAEGVKDGVFEDNDKALGIIVEESTRLKGIVEDLIFLSKLETMEDFYRLKDESMNDIIEKSVEKVNSLALKNNIRINPLLHTDATVYADRDKLTQALINILGNCLRHAGSEVGIISENGGNWLDITIYDDGDGFEEKDVKNVFERFYKGKKGDTGLGMAITKVIIEKHQGTVEALNRPEGGAQFRIRLPAKARKLH